MFTETKEYMSGAFMVKGQISLSVDAEIIHIDFKPMFGNHIGEDVVHKCLECGWGIAKPEQHYGGFKESKGSDEHSLPLIHLPNSDVVVPPTDVKLGEQGGILHIIDKLRDKW